MKYIISHKKIDQIYSEIHSEITDLRISLKDQTISPNIDLHLAQLEIKIWNSIRPILSKEEK